MSITSIKIFPPIGIARVGNSPTDFFIGPEIPGVINKPDGGYKDAECRVKRQAARFRLFGYDENGDFVREVTLNEPGTQISWEVHLCNQKSAYWSYDNEAAREGIDLAEEPRAINPRVQTLVGALQRARFNTAHFEYDNFRTNEPVDLGEVRTDEKGRLLVLGGFGRAGALDPAEQRLGDFRDNPNWYDDTSDGSVIAAVSIDGENIQVTPAWVIVGPPDFAPEIGNAITMYDRLVQFHAENQLLPDGFPLPTAEDFLPSYRNNVYPLLKRAWIDVQEVLDVAEENQISLDFDELAQRPEAEVAQTPDEVEARQGRIDRAREARNYVMQQLRRNGGQIPRSEVSLFRDITHIQYAMLEKWQNGDFVNDWNDEPISAISPEGLTQAALESMTGGRFFPGIEAGRQMFWDPRQYVANELFRIDHSEVRPGDLTKDLAVPWQADFWDCGGQGSDVCPQWVDAAWWPAQRPIASLDASTGNRLVWTRQLRSREDMASSWHTLGFVTQVNGEFEDSERCAWPSITLMTPVVDFGSVPLKPGLRPMPREIVQYIVFEISSEDQLLSFEIDRHPDVQNFTVVNPRIPAIGQGPAGRPQQLLIPISYVAQNVGEELSSSVGIRNINTGRRWTVDLTGSAVAPSRNAISLVLDASRSMTLDGGDGIAKTQNARDAAKILIDLMEIGNWVSITAFSADAEEVLPLTIVENDGTKNRIGRVIDGDGLDPQTVTSIGDGIEIGTRSLADIEGFQMNDRRSMLILTDGHENEPSYIDDVAHLVNSSTYAIGIGEGDNVNVSTLQHLTGNHGGYLVLTGALTPDSNNEFRMKKHFMQVLTSVEQKEVVYDPDGTLYSGQSTSIPFIISDAETSFDAILLSTPYYSKYAPWYLISPSGYKIEPEMVSENANVEFKQHESMSHFKISLPLKTKEGRSMSHGEWRAVIRHAQKEGGKPIRYSFNVHAHSELSFRASGHQNPGDPFTFKLEASLMQYVNLPVQNASVSVEVTTSEGNVDRFVMEKGKPGQFQGEYHNAKPGVHHVRLIARGTTHRGTPFQREQTLSFPVVLGKEKPETNNTWELDIPKKPKPAYRVFGRVVDSKGKGIPNLSIKAVDQDFTGENALGKPVETDDKGHYSIPYSLKDFAPHGKELNGADIILYLQNSKGEIIHATKPQRNAGKVSRINVTLPKP